MINAEADWSIPAQWQPGETGNVASWLQVDCKLKEGA